MCVCIYLRRWRKKIKIFGIIKWQRDKKIIKLNGISLKKIKWNGSKKIKWKKKTYWNIILKNKRKGSQRELKRHACEINCREVVFWSTIQQLLAKAHSILFYALKKLLFLVST